MVGICTALLVRKRKILGWHSRASTRSTSVLKRKLADLESRAEDLRQEIEATQATRSPQNGEIRVWMDGAFDMMHFGHANAFRKGRALGTHLVVGINDDASITQCKGGPPIMSEDERLASVRACKWVDEVVPGVPYIMSEQYLDWAIKEYKIDIVVHGDDPCIVDGRDVYESARKLGIYRTIPRTEGVSTTEIVGRMLLSTREHHAKGNDPLRRESVTEEEPSRAEEPEVFIRESKFLTTSQMMRLFAQYCTPPRDDARIVYVDGGWDMFHAGHVDFLRNASKLGDYLLVGVHSDAVVNRHRGQNFPILNQQERVLSVLACRYTSDIVIDPPWNLTPEMISALNISVVAHGTTHDHNEDERDPYEIPKRMGIFVTIPSRTGTRDRRPRENQPLRSLHIA
eukprot:scaffold125548_cov33-Tisochrysis_lutea.AAC.2